MVVLSLWKNTWIWTYLLCTCEHSQASAAGHTGMHNLMPEARNERETVHKEHKTATHICQGMQQICALTILGYIHKINGKRPCTFRIVPSRSMCYYICSQAWNDNIFPYIVMLCVHVTLMLIMTKQKMNLHQFPTHLFATSHYIHGSLVSLIVTLHYGLIRVCNDTCYFLLPLLVW